MDKLLTIGMATYDDYDGVFFTIQSLRMHHPICQTDMVEFVVINNNPTGKHSDALKKFCKSIGATYVPHSNVTSFSKYKIAGYATGEYVLIMDCHVLLTLTSVDELLKYYDETPDCRNLVQGTLIYTDLKTRSTHFKPEWRGHMWGTWACNKEGLESGKPFSIPMQGMGLLSFQRKHWPGIHTEFRGFGAEEGYIAEKFRKNGGDNVCLPQLEWMHRFDRPNGVPFRLTLEDRVFNYFLGWMDIGGENHPMVQSTYGYFKNRIPSGVIDKLLAEAKQKL